MRHERTLLSLASSVHPFKTAQQAHDSTMKTDTYQAWLDYPGPQLLYVHGTDGVREAGEQIFYSLNDLARTERNTHDLVLYFSFDRWDTRCDSTKDMLSTFLAQIICRHTRGMSRWVDILFEHLNQEHGWSESDLINWFDYFRCRGPVDSVSCVINYFDECTEASRKAFLEFFSDLARRSEKPWKIAVTSRKPGAILDELSEWPSINLDVAASETAPEDPRDVEKDIARLVQLRPELSVLDNLLREELGGLADLDSLARHIICEQARLCKGWPEETSIQTFLGPLDDPSDNFRDNRSLESILDRVLRNIPDQESVRRLLSWLLYCVRPLTTWELATVMFIGSDQDRGREAYPSPSVLQDLTSKRETWFAGIVEVEQNEVKIRHPRLRDIFMAPEAEGGRRYLWNEVKDTADFEITKLCLDYLSRASVQQIIKQTYQAPDSDLIEASTFPDRGNLCSYAVQAWTHHFSLIPPNLNPSKLLDNFMQSAIVPCWSKGYWALSNPVTRRSRCLESLYPIFAGLGLPYVVKPRDDEDFSLALLEAATNGRASAVKDLLEQTEYSKSTLLDALVAAGSSGEEQIMLDTIDHISAKTKNDTIDWPPVLLYRAAWLGLDRFAERLLRLGCPTEPGGPLQIKTHPSPLFLATRYGHLSTVRVLLKYKANVQLRSIWGTPFHWAAYLGHTEVAKALLEEGKVELEEKDEHGWTALYTANLFGNHETAEYLLQQGADPNMGITGESTAQGWSPLVVAAEDGYGKCVWALLESDANPNVSGPSGIDTPLRYAAVNGHREICRLLLEKGADPNSPLLQPPILVEIANFQGGLSIPKRLEVVKLLLENGAWVNATDGEGMTALVHAVRNGYEPLARCLLDHDADVNLTDERGRGPLYFAAQEQREDLVELLLQKEPDLNCQKSQGFAPLHVAHPSIKIAGLLLEKGANPDIRNHQGLTQLMYAASNGYTELAEMLLKHKAAVDAELDEDNEDWAGWTAVSFAASNGHPEVLRLLAEAGADLKHQAKEGLCPIHLAVKGNSLRALLEFRKKIDIDQVAGNGETALHRMESVHVPIANVKLLVNGGANLNLQDKMGNTPLTIAVFENDREVVSFLLEQDDLDINLGSPCYGAALHQACRWPSIDIAKMLVEHGADVNCTVSGVPGSPLQSACLQFSRSRDNYAEEIVHYLVEKGADVTARGGLVGSPISAAALGGTPSLVSLLLDKGATTDVSDGMGRMPIHFAASYGIDNFQLILEAGGDIKASDKTRRTALHWAAQHGRAQVVERILSVLPREVVDERDIDGWTPLCWAARGTENWLSWLSPGLAHEEADQIKVIQLLLGRGADRFTHGSIREQKWSPLKIARYCGADAEIINLLKRGLGGEGGDGSDNAAVTSGDDLDENLRMACDRIFFCNGCLWVSTHNFLFCTGRAPTTFPITTRLI